MVGCMNARGIWKKSSFNNHSISLIQYQLIPSCCIMPLMACLIIKRTKQDSNFAVHSVFMLYLYLTYPARIQFFSDKELPRFLNALWILSCCCPSLPSPSPVPPPFPLLLTTRITLERMTKMVATTTTQSVKAEEVQTYVVTYCFPFVVDRAASLHPCTNTESAAPAGYPY